MSDAIETVSRNIQLAMASNASDPATAAAMHTPKFRKALRQAFGKKGADELLRNLDQPLKAPAADAAMKTIAARIHAALEARQCAESSVVTATLAVDQLSSDHTRFIAQTLRDHAWDELWTVFQHLQAAMRLIPESDRPEDFELDESCANEAPAIEGAS